MNELNQLRNLRNKIMLSEAEEPQMQKQAQAGAQRQTQTDTPDQVHDTVSSLFNNFMDATTKNGLSVSTKQQGAVKQALKTKVASSEKTKAKLADMGAMDPQVAMQAASHLMNLANIDIEDIISDEEAARNAAGSSVETRPKPTDPDNLPALINKNLVAAGEMEVEFMQVKHLPGYMKNQIRALGRQVFAVFTTTAIEDISVMANVGGQGPNEMREINAVAGYARKHGKENYQAEINFDQSIPDYEAEVAVFDTEDTTFLLVKDFAGSYVYSWPSTDTKRLE